MYRFSDVELHIAAREVILDGHPVDLEPRAFDLLIYLIENRTRVVSKSELLEKVWKTAYVSESVLARAVMKLRKALSRDDTEADYVKTIHRVGYRFIGELEDVVQPTRTRQPSNSRLALLPILNSTQDDSFAWVELGLLTLVMRAITDGSEILLVPIASVLTTIQGIGAALDSGQGQLMLREALGVDCMVQLAVTKESNASFALSWQVWRAEQHRVEGALHGPQLTDLAMQFAARFAAIVNQQPVVMHALPLTPDQDFANAAHARAIQAFAREQYPQAVTLMRACTDIEPHAVRMDIDLAAMLVPTRPREAQACCEALLEQRSELTANDLLALFRALANLALHDREWDKCEAFCAQAETLIEERGGTIEDGWVASCRFKIALMRGEVNFARHTAQDILNRARVDRDQVRISQGLASLGWLELEKGDEAAGKSLLTEAIDLARSHRLSATQSLCLHELARHMRCHGHVEEAISLFIEAAGLNQTAGYAIDTAQVYANLYRAYVDQGATPAALECVARINQIVAEVGRSTAALRATCIDAEMRFGDQRRAKAEAVAELQLLETSGEPHWSLGAYLTILVAVGAVDDATYWLDRLTSSVEVPSAEMSYTTYLSALAQIRYAQGDMKQALAALERHVALRGGVLGATLVCTDVLWITLEAGRIEDAASLAVAMPEHLRQSLRGRVSHARLHYQLGEIDLAQQLQDQVIERAAGHRALPYLELIGKHYRHKPSTRSKLAFPRAPALPSAY